MVDRKRFFNYVPETIQDVKRYVEILAARHMFNTTDTSPWILGLLNNLFHHFRKQQQFYSCRKSAFITINNGLCEPVRWLYLTALMNNSGCCPEIVIGGIS